MRAAFLVLGLGFLSFVASAQQSEEEVALQHRRDFDRQVEQLRKELGVHHVLEGADVPLCRRVYAFLPVAQAFGQDPRPEIRKWFMEAIGMSGPANEIFNHHLEAGLRVIYGDEGPHRRFDESLGTTVVGTAPGDPTAVAEFSEDAARQQEIALCEQLGEVWGSLLGELEPEGITTAALQRFIDVQIDTSIASDEPFDESNSIFAAGQAFTEKMNEARARHHH